MNMTEEKKTSSSTEHAPVEKVSEQEAMAHLDRTLPKHGQGSLEEMEPMQRKFLVESTRRYLAKLKAMGIEP